MFVETGFLSGWTEVPFVPVKIKRSYSTLEETDSYIQKRSSCKKLKQILLSLPSALYKVLPSPNLCS